jgi:hypothetical protein
LVAEVSFFSHGLSSSTAPTRIRRFYYHWILSRSSKEYFEIEQKELKDMKSGKFAVLLQEAKATLKNRIKILVDLFMIFIIIQSIVNYFIPE